MSPKTKLFLASLGLWALSLCTFPGCNPSRQAHRYFDNHPEEFAKDCADEYPVKVETIYKEGKIILDTLYQPITVIDTFECPPADSAIKYQVKIETRSREIIKKQTDTVIHREENTAKSAAWEQAYAKEVERRMKTEDKLAKKQKQNSWLWIILVAIVALAGVWVYFKIRTAGLRAVLSKFKL